MHDIWIKKFAKESWTPEVYEIALRNGSLKRTGYPPFKAGFLACHSAYLEMANATWDEKAVIDQILAYPMNFIMSTTLPPKTYYEHMNVNKMALDISRWVHSRSVALLAELREENARLKSTYVSQPIASACLDELAPLDKVGEPNTLLALAQKAMRRIAELEAQLGVAVETMNKVSGIILPFMKGGSFMSENLRRAFNENASFLADNPELQNKFLASLKGEKS